MAAGELIPVECAAISNPRVALGNRLTTDEDGLLLSALLQFFATGDRARELTDYLAVSAEKPCSRKRKELIVDAIDLFEEVPASYLLLAQGWPTLTTALNHAVSEAAVKLSAPTEDGQTWPLFRVRLAHVPGREFARQSVSQLRVGDDGRLVRVVGTVTRAGPVKVVQEWRSFRCEQCSHTFRCRASPACGYEFEVPRECPSGQKQTKWDPKAKRPKTSRCHSRLFCAVQPSEECMSDFQELRVQDDMQALEVGVVPQSCAIVVFGDMVGVAQPGDSVLVEGIVFQRWRPTFQGKRVEIELFVEAINVERLARESSAEASLTNRLRCETQESFRRFWADAADEWKGRSSLLAATAPWLSGLPVPKLALLLTLIGGMARRDKAHVGSAETDSRWGRFLGTATTEESKLRQNEGEAGQISAVRHSRTTPHLLLLGDPGTGKSQLLQAAQELGGRSIRTSGLGCTSAGLTCAAVRDGPDWALEAGALVLADGGVCCIDEFSTIRSHDKAAIHEAMEQQTVSVAKAGMVCRLHSRCSVVAAQNCRGSAGKGRGQGSAYDVNSSLAVNSGLPPPLLSRFDLVVVFAEGGKGGATESEKADFIIHSTGGPATGRKLREKDQVSWDHNRLRDYLLWAKEICLDEDDEPGAAVLLQTYFQKLRCTSLTGPGSGGVTARTLESLVRLAQAHAKLMGRRNVQIEDGVAVVVLHRAALQDHVVGAESLPAGDDFAPSLRDWEDETAACGVKVSLEGLDLHHGSDIPSMDVYKQLEQAILKSLKLCRSSDKRHLVPLQQAMAIADAPRLGSCSQTVPGEQPEDSLSTQATQSSTWPVPPHETREQTKPRGRQLGCRVR